MKHARIQQRDFFDPAPDLNIEPLDAAEMEAPRGEPIAIPCGFMTKTNERCQRLASRPVMLEGHQMTCRGRPMRRHADIAAIASERGRPPVRLSRAASAEGRRCLCRSRGANLAVS